MAQHEGHEAPGAAAAGEAPRPGQGQLPVRELREREAEVLLAQVLRALRLYQRRVDHGVEPGRADQFPLAERDVKCRVPSHSTLQKTRKSGSRKPEPSIDERPACKCECKGDVNVRPSPFSCDFGV